MNARDRRFAATFAKQYVASQIQTLREEKGWSQQQLAEAAGISQGVISRAENPNYGNLSLNTMIRIAAGLGVVFVGKFEGFDEFLKVALDLLEKP